MKPSTLLLVASLAINAALGAVIVWRPAATAAFFREVFPRDPEAAQARAAKRSAPSAAPETTGAARADDASAPPPLAPDDFRGLLARLEAAGLPPGAARMAVMTTIHRHFDARRREIAPRPNPAEYWRNPVHRADPQQQKALRELEREQRALLREVLGPDPVFADDEERLARQRRQFGDLPEAKVAQLRKILTDYDDLTRDVVSDTFGRDSADHRAKLALLEKEKRADLERLLTSEELFDYDLRNSRASHTLRARLGQFQATEAEFRALYPVQETVAKFDALPRPHSPEIQRQRAQAQEQLDAEFRRVLGEARYAEFKLASDPSYQQTSALVTRLGLPPAAVNNVLAVQKELQPRIAAVHQNRDLTANQRDAQLAALAQEANARLTPVLGPSGVEAYRRQGGGWLSQLNRPQIARPLPLPQR